MIEEDAHADLSSSPSLSLSLSHFRSLWEKAEEEGEFTLEAPRQLLLHFYLHLSFFFFPARARAVSPYFSIILLSFPFVYATFLPSSSQILPSPPRAFTAALDSNPIYLSTAETLRIFT